MALPQSVLERMSREPVGTPGWSGGLIFFSATVLLLSLFVYAGLEYGYKPKLTQDIADLDIQIKNFSQKVTVEDQEKITSFYSQLSNAKKLLENHIVVSPVFNWIQNVTNNNVYYTKFALTVDNRQLALGGAARSMADVTNQVALFQRQPNVEKVGLGSVGVDQTGSWKFDMTLTFSKNFFTPRAVSGAPAGQSATSSTASSTSQ